MIKKLALFGVVLGMGIMLAGKVCAEPLTATMCKDKVVEAAKLIEAEGTAAFEKLKDPAGAFRFGDGEGYIWVHDSKNVMIMHPIKPALDGKTVADMKDAKGTYLFVNMTDLAMENGSGWVVYAWPKPGKTEASSKVSYVSKVEKDGETYIVGSGIYDVTAADIKKEFPGDALVAGDE
ncbi:MAG: cache domain-containing protein [Candidatus Omnitrophota bacterium]